MHRVTKSKDKRPRTGQPVEFGQILTTFPSCFLRGLLKEKLARFDIRRGHQMAQFSQTEDGRECMRTDVCLSVLITNEVKV